jgi:hypothetical protein
MGRWLLVFWDVAQCDVVNTYDKYPDDKGSKPL